MADFRYVAWGSGLIGKFVLESGSGIYRGQCTQVVSQLLKDLGYPAYNKARGNGNQVGASMVAAGEAVFVGTNLTSVPAGQIHVVCTGVGDLSTAGHVFVAGANDVVYEQNVRMSGLPTRNFGIGPTYPFRLGRLGESFRGTKHHYKVLVNTDFDSIDGSGDSGGDPDDNDGDNQNRLISKNLINIQKSKSSKYDSARTSKKYHPIPYGKRQHPTNG